MLYTENTAAAAIDTSLTVSDPDNALLDHARVRVSGNYVDGEDVLAFTDQLGIIGVWDAGTGTLVLIGAASPADYQTALRSVTYRNLSEHPSTAQRTVSFVANDGIADGAIATRRIGVTAVNDPPANTVPGSQTTTEDTPLGFSIGGGNEIRIADVDAEANPVKVTLTATNGVLTLAQTNGLTFVGGSNGTSLMTVTALVSDLNAALNGMSFNPTADYAGRPACRLRPTTRATAAPARPVWSTARSTSAWSQSMMRRG